MGFCTKLHPQAFLNFFETGSQKVSKLPSWAQICNSPEYWDYGLVPPCLALFFVVICFVALRVQFRVPHVLSKHSITELCLRPALRR